MARIRSVKPEFFYSEQVTSVSMTARLFFIGLWTVADREGRLQWAPRKLKVQIFPYDDVQLFELAEELTRAGLLHIYEVDQHAYAWIPGFKKHQRPHPKEVPSECPECPIGHAASDLPWKLDVLKSPLSREQVIPSREQVGCIPASPTGKGREGKEISESGNGSPPLTRSLIARRDLTAFYEGAIFNVPDKWAQSKLRGSQGSLTDAELSKFCKAAQSRAETEQVDFSRVNLLNWLDTALREWRDQATRQQQDAVLDASGNAFLAKVARMEAGQ